MSTHDAEREENSEDVADQDEERRPGDETPRDRDEPAIHPEAGENPS